MDTNQILKWINELQCEIDRLKKAAGGGSNVSITPTFEDGVKIADYEIDGTENSLYIPAAINLSTVPQNTGRKWADGRELWAQSFYGTLSAAASNLKIGEIADFAEAIFIVGTVSGGGTSLQTPWNSGAGNIDQAYCRVIEATGEVQITHSFYSTYPNYHFTVYYLKTPAETKNRRRK